MSDPSEPSTLRPPRRSRFPRILLIALLIGGVLLLLGPLLVRSMFIEPFRIPAGSMEPTLRIGDHILVDKLVFGLHYPLTRIPADDPSLPKRGDVVVFVFPGSDEGELGEILDLPFDGIATLDYVKRVMGLPGDTVEVRDDWFILNGERLKARPTGSDTFKNDRCTEYPVEAIDESLDGRTWTTWRSTRFREQIPDFGPMTVPDGHVFVLGDNRDHSSDSRAWGFVPQRNLKGRVTSIWFSHDACTGAVRRERFGLTL